MEKGFRCYRRRSDEIVEAKVNQGLPYWLAVNGKHEVVRTGDFEVHHEHGTTVMTATTLFACYEYYPRG